MKKFLFLSCALALFCQFSLKAQILPIHVNGQEVTCQGKALPVDKLDSVIAEANPATVFLYVTMDTPITLVNEIQATIEAGNKEVVILNPDRYADKNRAYGPVAACHPDFRDFDLLEQSAKDGQVVYLDATKPVDEILAALRVKDNDGNLKNLFNTVVFELDAKATIGTVYGLGYSVDYAEEDVPFINVLFRSPAVFDMPAKYFKVQDIDLGDYDIKTVSIPEDGTQAIYTYRGEEGGIDVFTNSFVAYKSKSQIKGEATPGVGRAIVQFEITPLGTIQDIQIVRGASLKGLDSVITEALSGTPGYWTPQFGKDGSPVRVKVTAPIPGEIGQY